MPEKSNKFPETDFNERVAGLAHVMVIAIAVNFLVSLRCGTFLSLYLFLKTAIAKVVNSKE